MCRYLRLSLALYYLDHSYKRKGVNAVLSGKKWLLLLGCMITAMGMTAQQWYNVGPAPIAQNYNGVPIGVGPISGRVEDVAVDPSNPNHWLAAGVQGGIWSTYDGGTTWKAVSDDQPTLAMGAIAFARSKPSVVYAGTGAGSRGHPGAGFLKSVDGGDHWQVVAWDPFENVSVREVQVDPSNHSALVVASEEARRGGTAVGAPRYTNTKVGIFKSTDGGWTWVQKITAPATDIKSKPYDFRYQYAGVGETYESQASLCLDANKNDICGVYRSTDAGDTWREVTPPGVKKSDIGRIRMAIAPSNPDVLYLAIVKRSPDDSGLDNDSVMLGVWKTGNAWAEQLVWTQIGVSSPMCTGYSDDPNGQDYPGCQYRLDISVDPADENNVFGTGVGLKRCFPCIGPLSSWNRIGWTKLHVDQTTLAWAPNTLGSVRLRLLVGNDGGLYSTTDMGRHWKNHTAAKEHYIDVNEPQCVKNAGCKAALQANANLSIAQFTSGAVHPKDPYRLLGGTFDTGTALADGTNWEQLQGGDGGTVEFACGNPKYWVFDGTIVRKCPQDEHVGIRTFSRTDEHGNVVSSLLQKTLLQQALNLCTSVWDIQWSDISNTDEFKKHPYTVVTNAAFANTSSRTVPPDCDTFAYVTTPQQDPGLRQILLTTDGGTTITNADPQNQIPNGVNGSWIATFHALTFHPFDANIMYVAIDGGQEGVQISTTSTKNNLFKSTNLLSGSPSWQNVSVPTTDLLNSVFVDPVNPEIVYVGTIRGMWQSTNAGRTWTHLTPATGFPAAEVFDIRSTTSGWIHAFTWGRGALAMRGSIDLAGDRDDFHPGDEADKTDKSPHTRQLLDDLAKSLGPAVDMDVTAWDNPVGWTHRFSMPAGALITSAKVRFRVRFENTLAKNDILLYDETLKPPTLGQVRGQPYIALRDLLGREPQSGEVLELELDLARAPIRTSALPPPGQGFHNPNPDEIRDLLPLLADGQFDMVVLDDTTVDWSQISVTFIPRANPPSAPEGGDLDGDGDVDNDDVKLVSNALGTLSYHGDPRDLNQDGWITSADVTILQQLCTRTGCAVR